ncbi:hypothetical protein RclHR1_29750001 [Rhizophagus clarus]|uniref:Transposable element Tcb1 transposase isoform X2 n=1 Tax=Rhizophagus clarus TaxID=94130 RepID=A0A2Z6RKX3_9GLOM|nr:hypothetical protein RclHR1_29750001 [Rhizophagus clarus]GES86443.1 transposable element Tcb1 transposase isoform X2 [Rhizophagus clarus]
MKPSEIIKITGFPKSTVYDIVNRLKKTGSVEHSSIPGHPLILSPTKHRYLGCLLKNDNATTSALMTTKLNNLYSNLNVSHIEAHLQWALNHIQDDWSHMIFLDESTFQTFHNTQIVCYKAGNLCPSHPMQDNVPTHTAKLNQQFFVINNVPVIDWSANSPDLNPIENL